MEVWAAAETHEQDGRPGERWDTPPTSSPPSFPTAVPLMRCGFFFFNFISRRCVASPVCGGVHVCVTPLRRDPTTSFLYFLSFKQSALSWSSPPSLIPAVFFPPWHLLTFSQSLSSATFFFFFFVFAAYFCRQHGVKSSERSDCLRRSHKFLCSVFERGEKISTHIRFLSGSRNGAFHLKAHSVRFTGLSWYEMK